MENNEMGENSYEFSRAINAIDAQEPDCQGVTYADAAGLLHGVPQHGADGRHLSRELSEFERGEHLDAEESLCAALGW